MEQMHHAGPDGSIPNVQPRRLDFCSCSVSSFVFLMYIRFDLLPWALRRVFLCVSFFPYPPGHARNQLIQECFMIPLFNKVLIDLNLDT